MEEKDLEIVMKLEEEIKKIEADLEKNKREIELAETNLNNAKKRLEVRLNNREILEGRKAKKELEKLKIEVGKKDN